MRYKGRIQEPISSDNPNFENTNSQQSAFRASRHATTKEVEKHGNVQRIKNIEMSFSLFRDILEWVIWIYVKKIKILKTD